MDISILLSIIVGFVVSAVAGKLLIPALRALKAGQSIKEIGPTWHMSKQGTPTMGGLMFILAIAVAVAALSWGYWTYGRLGGLYTFLFALVFGAIGFLDDYMKVKSTRTPASPLAGSSSSSWRQPFSSRCCCATRVISPLTSTSPLQT